MIVDNSGTIGKDLLAACFLLPPPCCIGVPFNNLYDSDALLTSPCFLGDLLEDIGLTVRLYRRITG